MTNTIAFWLAVLILGFFAIDFFFLEDNMFLFLGRKLVDLLEYVAFWR